MQISQLSSPFLQYLATHEETERLPSLNVLSAELGISVAKLREQLAVARALGLVEVRPRTGIRRIPFSFLPAVRESLLYAVARDWSHFEAFANLRKQVEAAYWRQAAGQLLAVDHQILQDLVAKAWGKLRGNPIKIPHTEHRQLHLTVFRRLENPFVTGILEAYWDAYEAVGLNLYTEYGYLQDVWTYHQQMVDHICEDDLDAGYQAFVAHTDLLYHRPGPLTADGEQQSAIADTSE